MPARRKKSRTGAVSPVHTIDPNAAGIDIGATEIYFAVPVDRDPHPVRRFATFTEDLLAAADWLQRCGIKTVAMESTGVYWIPLFQILEARGLKVCLVNARHVKNVPGRKSDVCDCQWLQHLHSAGLLRASFRPSSQVCAVRSLVRYRDSLVQLSAMHLQHMQKALDQMNLQLHHVISDLGGKTGMAIVEAILAGERDPHQLARLRDPRTKASQETIAKSLVGDYRCEHLFTLRQSLTGFRQNSQLIADCDVEIESLLKEFSSGDGPGAEAVPEPQAELKRKPRRNEMNFDLRTQLHRIFAVDLTEIPGINTLTAHALFTEVGRDLSKFANVAAFTSWMGLCPDNRVSGGKILHARTRKVNNRVARALRMAAQTLARSHGWLGQYYRRMRAKLGGPKAVTATAHKLARIVYHLLTTGQAYDETVFAQQEAQDKQRNESRLRHQARKLGFQLTLIPTEV
jgi:transposase